MIQFLVNYCGQKYRETKHLKNIDYSKYKYILEPFGGSFGFSRYLFYELNLKDINFIIYDYDKDLIDFYKYIKKLVINKKINKFVKKYNTECEYILKNFNYKGHKRLLNCKQSREYINTIKNKKLKWLLNKNLFRGGRSTINFKHNCDFEIFKKCSFKCINIYDIEMKDYDETYLIYLDPPYLLSDNTSYMKSVKSRDNMKNIFKVIDGFFNNNNCLFIHSYNYLLYNYYKKYYKMDYKKTYGSGNKANHCVFSNIDFNASVFTCINF